MRPIRPSRLAAALVALGLMVAPAAALADGDPASDILLNGDTFFPYQPQVSPNVAAAVNGTVARAHAAGFPIKVAIIAATTDLGAVSNLFGQPQKYADFLAREIAYNKKAALLVVMPQGFGIVGAGPPSVLAGVTVASGGDADGMGRAAMTAVGALAAHAGHPIALPEIPSSRGSSGGGPSPALTFGAPLALVLLVAVGGAALARRRRGQTDEPWREDDE